MAFLEGHDEKAAGCRKHCALDARLHECLRRRPFEVLRNLSNPNQWLESERKRCPFAAHFL
jgi:hypothetical protein